jgi:hypothetical protein
MNEEFDRLIHLININRKVDNDLIATCLRYLSRNMITDTNNLLYEGLSRLIREDNGNILEQCTSWFEFNRNTCIEPLFMNLMEEKIRNMGNTQMLLHTSRYNTLLMPLCASKKELSNVVHRLIEFKTNLDNYTMNKRQEISNLKNRMITTVSPIDYPSKKFYLANPNKLHLFTFETCAAAYTCMSIIKDCMVNNKRKDEIRIINKKGVREIDPVFISFSHSFYI